MLSHAKKYFFIAFVFCAGFSLAQNQQSKWYFGHYAALDFMQNPPAPILSSAMNAIEGCASIADANGNLLFYTDGVTVYNQSNAVMANGTGLFGNATPAQSCLIVQKPGSVNLYYVFTVWGNSNPMGFNYSVVDMNMATGQGSVTIKNAPVYNAPCLEGITGARHCNGNDYWIVVHEKNTNNFRTYLLSAAGLNTTAVVSPIGNTLGGIIGTMKISPNAEKLAMAMVPNNLDLSKCMSLFDFDNSSGILSNYVSLPVSGFSYGLEFSPDGSKLYGGSQPIGGGYYIIFNQWNLCAGYNPPLAISHFSMELTNANSIGSMQLAIDGKIYVITGSGYSISVINTPNLPGALCNFVLNAQSIGGNYTSSGLPNFIKQYNPVPPSFSWSLSSQGCRAVTFTANIPAYCPSSNYSVTSMLWDFGDPATGTLNVASGINPVHIYSSSGTFSTTLIVNYKCGADTIRQLVQIPPPDIVVTWLSNCNGTASATVSVVGGIGPYTYLWQPSSQTSSVVSNLQTGTYSVTVTDMGLGCTVQTLIAINLNSFPNFSVNVAPNPAFVCLNSAITLTANGTGGNTYTYTWLPSFMTGNQLYVNATDLQTKTYTVVASLNNCTASAVAAVSVKPLPTAQISILKNGKCVNDSLILNGSGGISYSWVLPNGNSIAGQDLRIKTNSQNFSGTYTLIAYDENSCSNTKTQSVTINLLPNGFVSAQSFTGCVPLCNEYVFVPSNSITPLMNISWNMNNKNFSGNNINYCFTQAGEFSIETKLKDQNNCANTITTQVIVYPKPNADFVYLPKEPIENLDEVIFINTSKGAEKFSWQFADGSLLSAEEHANYLFENTGTYVVALVAQSDKQCLDTVVKSIYVRPDFTVFVPNVFSPNGDNLNDVFIPVTRGTTQMHLMIFNRWGEMLFESNELNLGWDGAYKGEPCKVDVYVWKLTVSNSKEEKELSGTVLLER